MSTLIEDAQKHIESYMQKASGDDDFPPFLAMKNAAGKLIIAGLAMPDRPDEKDELCDLMTALCLMHQATEAVFASVCWMVSCADREAADGVIPSQHPDRIEVVTMTALKLEGKTETIMSNVIRENNMVGVGLWEPLSNGEATGRFINAIRFGLSLGSKVPPQFSAVVDGLLTDGEATAKVVNEVRGMITTMRTMRKSAFNN